MSERKRLPDRRAAETFSFRHSVAPGAPTMIYIATIGRSEDGQIAEVFLNSTKLGSGADANARDAAIAVSLALQHGVPLDVLRSALTRNHDGSASTPIGALLDIIAKEDEPMLQAVT